MFVHKLFGRVDEHKKKNYIKLAIDIIKSICQNGPSLVSHL
jgi:hypothetical protein